LAVSIKTIRCHRLSGNNCEVSFVKNVLVLHETNAEKFHIKYELFALFHRRGNKQAAKERH